MRATEIYWTDKSQITHLCTREEAVPGIFLVWTLCEIDVPANQGYKSSPASAVTCSKCLKANQG